MTSSILILERLITFILFEGFSLFSWYYNLFKIRETKKTIMIWDRLWIFV